MTSWVTIQEMGVHIPTHHFGGPELSHSHVTILHRLSHSQPPDDPLGGPSRKVLPQIYRYSAGGWDLLKPEEVTRANRSTMTERPTTVMNSSQPIIYNSYICVDS